MFCRFHHDFGSSDGDFDNVGLASQTTDDDSNNSNSNNDYNQQQPKAMTTNDNPWLPMMTMTTCLLYTSDAADE